MRYGTFRNQRHVFRMDAPHVDGHAAQQVPFRLLWFQVHARGMRLNHKTTLQSAFIGLAWAETNTRANGAKQLLERVHAVALTHKCTNQDARTRL